VTHLSFRRVFALLTLATILFVGCGTGQDAPEQHAAQKKPPPAREIARYPTVRQPNSVAVDPASGRVFVTGKADGQLQILEPR
jgi:DNA-binding beta-propeller fold protein YncE